MINRAERTEMLLALKTYYNSYRINRNISSLKTLSDNELKKEYYSIYRKECVIA